MWLIITNQLFLLFSSRVSLFSWGFICSLVKPMGCLHFPYSQVIMFKLAKSIAWSITIINSYWLDMVLNCNRFCTCIWEKVTGGANCHTKHLYTLLQIFQTRIISLKSHSLLSQNVVRHWPCWYRNRIIYEKRC